MRLAIVLGYVAVEIGAFALAIHLLGFGWAVLAGLAVFTVGLIVLRRHTRKLAADLRRASRNEIDPVPAMADTGLTALAATLLLLPGVVSTVAGMGLLAPPVRKLARPTVTAYGTRRFNASMDRIGLYSVSLFTDDRVRPGDVIDGDILDGDVVYTDPVATPDHYQSSMRSLPQAK
ncbi:FxsA family protein [Gordonia sp. (in: high G+C Gram-positive bacteria)]|jgi:UPF0716 protein FxsA|uniref:FxsA family protein n=1 Tax=Gordonia sp. (in: high G+C Gram-positive bacteria) TaxID=84139 RepID=UPI002603B560|nr:FxsA family protein [Gordonia sp. (in: high G+C Gram-positive bacteria)]HMS77442.1 FxsA family protein [Gordonia sp. (in: high G+C Gram-positive bacteria)]